VTDLYDNIPLELRALNQFCLWKLEDRGGTKPTKPLYTKFNKKASVLNPADWCSYGEAVNLLRTTDLYNGLGFVFTEQDGYAGIDIDVPKNIAEEQLRDKVWNAFPSYSERSPSGQGYHIICKGSLLTGRRRMSVECYSSGRYFTMTGDIVRDIPIIDCQDNLDILWNEMSSGQQPNPYFETEDGEQIREDDEIIKVAASAKNQEKFNRLNAGDITGYPSQSEADQAYINMLSFYTDSKTQVARVFLASPLGQREKAWKHPSYLRNTIHKSFDQKLPPIDLSAVQTQLAAMLKKPDKAVLKPSQEPIPWPPGLIGDIADFIYKQAPRPVHDIALAAAIGLLAGICGQAYNVSNSGLNLYIIVIARTGRGKEQMASGINKIISKAAKIVPHIEDYIGPSDMASGAGLAGWLERSSCFLSVMGEVGHRLAAICNPNAPSHEINLKTMLLDLYHKSGFEGSMKPKAYSTKSQKEHVTIERPCFTMIGESTPERFFDVLDDSLIADGFLPRFLIFQYDGDRTYLAKDFARAEPSEAMVQRLVELATHCREIVDGRRVEIVQFESQAEHMLDEFDRFTSDAINASPDSKFEEIYNRAHMKALRLAALVAVGNNFLFPMVSVADAQWAIDVIMRDINNMLFRFKSGEVSVKKEGNQMEHIGIIRNVLRLWFTRQAATENYNLTDQMLKEGAFTTNSLNVRLNGNKAFKSDRRGVPAAVKDALRIMQEDGEIIELTKMEGINRFDKRSLIYQVTDLSRFQ